MAEASWLRNVGMAATVLIMVLMIPGTPTVFVGHSPGGAVAGSASGAVSHVGPAAMSGAHVAQSTASTAHGLPHAAPIGLWNNSASCQARQDKWNELFDQGAPPTDVLHTEQSPCYIGHDEPGLNFVSNDSGSGSRVQFTVSLPAAGTYTGSAFATMWLGMWLAGVPCSYRGQSYLEIQINPPDNAIGLTSNPNWTVQAPVWDLVPVGSCDPQCQNDTAVDTIGGVNYCEDDAAIAGVGTYTATGWGNFAPGDQLVVQMVGAVGGGTGLTCYINDTTDPSQNLNWTYSADVTASGLPLTPYYDASSWSNGGWGYGLNVEATWENCPEADGPTSCNSYNGPAVNAVSVPTFTSATFWNSTTQSYSNPFPWTAATSSAAACSGYAAPCLDYTTYGGTGFYPYWSLHAWGGQAWWTYGGTYPHEVTNYGGASQFNILGFIPTWLDPTAVYHTETSQVGSTLSVTASVADPNGVRAVQVGGFWCFSGSSPSVTTASGALAAGPFDTSAQGNWTAVLPTNGMSGTMNYWVRAQSVSGVWSNPDVHSVSISGGSACAFPGPAIPTFAPSNIVSVGGGYNLTWSDPSPGIANYTIWFNASTNGTPFSIDVGPQTAAFENLYWDNQSFNISIVAWDYSGQASAPTPWVLAPATLNSLAADLSGPTTDQWVGQGPLSFTGTATNGVGPFTYLFVFGDGSTLWVGSPNASVTVSHDYGSYFGGARCNVTIWDSLGDVGFSGRIIVPILATPLGVPQTIAAGDGFAEVSWSAPLSPIAPATHYTVYYTQNPDWSWALTEFWPYNYTAPYDTFVWNTTGTSLRVSVPDGSTLFAQVVAWNSYGEGLLPDGSPILSATPAPFVVGAASGPSGIAAPFTGNYVAMVTSGSGDTLTTASYSFAGGASVAATVGGGSGTFWLNASFLWTMPGPQTVSVLAIDQFGESAETGTSIYVATGAAPSVTVGAPTGILWAGAPVSLTATVGGTSTYTYAWDLGDGSNASGSSVMHTYAAAGTFTTVLTTIDTVGGGQTVTVTPLTVYALPGVTISTSHGPNGLLSYVFTAVVAGGTHTPPTFAWTLGDGTTGTGAVVTHDFPASGTYQVNVTVNSSGQFSTGSVTLQVSSGAGGGPSNEISWSGSNGALLIGLVLLVVIFLLTTLYFWSRSRRPPMVMAPETPKPAP